MALTIGAQLGSHEITGLLGKGGMGEVYRARDLKLKREVAIKILPEEFSRDADRLSRFQREAEVLAALNHPNIAAIYDLDEANGVRFLVLELVEGETLAYRVSRGHIAIEEALTTAIQICDALEATHKKGIIHRDLKPANIKVTTAGVAKVLDFGLAKSLSEDGETNLSQWTTATEDGAILGTPAYMSPEQVRGQIVDEQCDIWAFGCVLFEMLAGQSLFGRKTASDTIAAVLEHEPQWHTLPEHTPSRVRELLRRCLAKDARHRLHHVADARIELENAALQAVPRVAWRKATSSLRWFLGIAAVAFVFAVGLYLRSRNADMPGLDETRLIALPAQVLGAPDLSFLADAIPNTLSTQLSQVEGLDTKVPPSSAEFETIHRNLSKIADLYGVNTCIVSSIAVTDPGHFVLNVQLVEPRSGRILWGQQYEGARGSYLELAHQAASAVRERLKPRASQTAAGAGQTTSSEAELDYREGMYFSNKYNNLHQPENFEKASAAFQRALASDSKFANAAAAIAILYRFKWESGAQVSPVETIEKIESWARQALAIDPRCSRAWSALAWAEFTRSPVDYRKTLEYSAKAVAFDAHDSFAQLSLGLSLQFVSDDLSLLAFKEARRTDPLYLYSYLQIANELALENEYPEALKAAEDGLQIEPEMNPLLQAQFWLLSALDRKAEVATWAQNRPQESAGSFNQYLLATEEGNTNKAQSALAELVKDVNDARYSSGVRRTTIRRLAPYLIQHGQASIVVPLLTRLAELGDMPYYTWLAFNPSLDSVRGQTEFQAVVIRARPQFEELLKILDELQKSGELPRYLEKPLSDLSKRALKS
jgi:tetratricopeptide (TPR) repeat protein